MSEDRHGYYIRTYTGRRFWPADARPDDVHIEDIAHALALCNRFAGHTVRPYSVAQHSVLIARSFGDDKVLAKHALLHDAAEAYIGDLTRPLKKLEELEAFGHLENNLLSVICQRFGITSCCPEAVKEADQAMLRAELRDLVRDSQGWQTGGPCLVPRVDAWPWWEAEFRFLEEFSRLWPEFGFAWPTPPTVLVHVPMEDLHRLTSEITELRKMRDEAHRREDGE